MLLGSLFSFSAIPKFEILMFTASELLDKINSHIADLQFERTPKGLYDPVAYVLSMGGKRIRPVLMLMAYNLYKEDVRPVFSSATGIEVYHNYTLLHDDLMDRADKRRGKETVHKVWNDNTAILRGTQCWCWLISLWRNVRPNI